MIKRLTNLELEDFRTFRGPVSVPLDADVVIIYGPNGSGKTGLISALEYAVTGGVEDLRVFSDDYPRCLRNIRAAGEPKSCLYFESMAGESLHLSTPAAGDHDPKSKPADISENDRRFFSERCYISQRQLGRLFEIYQSSDKQQPEQPLVRFVRELLALDLLENLTIGTYEAGNITRLQKSSPPLAALKAEEASVPGQRTRLKQQREERAVLFNESLSAIKAILSGVGDPLPDEAWTAPGLRARIQALESSAQIGNLLGTLQRLQQSQGRLESAVGLLRASSSETPLHDPKGLRARLDALGRNLIEPKLTLLLQEGERVLGSLKEPTSQLAPHRDVGRRLDEIEESAGSGVAQLETEIRVRNEAEQETRSLGARAAELEGAIKKGEASSGRRSKEQRRWVELLQGVLDHLGGEVCPVCGRDYSQLRAGSLKSRITDELNKLGLDAERLDLAAKQRAQLETERDGVLRRIAAIKERATHDQSPLEVVQARRGELAKLTDALAAARSLRQEWRRLQQEEAGIQAELRTIEERASQQDKSTLQVSQLADELGIPIATRPTDAQSVADLVSSRLQTQIDELERQRRGRDELLTALAKAERIARELEELDGNANALTQKEQRIQRARGRVDQYVEKARTLARAANIAKERLLKEVFNDTLNALWEDLFERLVKLETFVPRLSEPTVKRGQIRAAIRAIATGAEPFEQAGSVLSAGNLNTAALSLFLSLNLVEPPRHRVIVLDDPVQSMDDIHVTQLANLLRAIVREADRQLVLSVHERSLYEYLCLEFGPTRESDSLLAIEVVRDREGGGSTVQYEKRSWKPDLVTFGA
jgi:DNA repair protein SbcC/Rad50